MAGCAWQRDAAEPCAVSTPQADQLELDAAIDQLTASAEVRNTKNSAPFVVELMEVGL